MKPLFFVVVFLAMLTQLNAQEQVSKEYLLGKFNPAEHELFTKIADEYTNKPGIYLRKEVYDAFKDMYFAAKKCGVELNIISATRSFAYQRGIWERKWRSDRFSAFEGKSRVKEIMKFSAMPGISRHHWGTDIDLNNLNNSYFEKGEGAKVYEWLVNHAADYGFHQPYTNKKDGRKGYEEEKWHWTYLPISSELLEGFNEKVKPSDIKGFSGSEFANELNVIQDFVNGVELP